MSTNKQVKNKNDLISDLQSEFKLSEKISREYINYIFNNIAGSLKTADEVYIPKFGKFKVRTRDIDINAPNATRVTIKGLRVATFKPSKSLKTLIQNN